MYENYDQQEILYIAAEMINIWPKTRNTEKYHKTVSYDLAVDRSLKQTVDMTAYQFHMLHCASS